MKKTLLTVDATTPRTISIDKKKISSGTQGKVVFVEIFIYFVTDNFIIPSFCGIFVSRLVTSIRNKKCSVFHICLFIERYDFCDFDIGCSSVSTNFVKHRTRFYWIIKRKPNIHVLTRGWVMQFPTLL